MPRATSNRLLTESLSTVQLESGYSNFRLLLEYDSVTSSKIPARFVKNVPIHPLGKSRR